MLDGFDVFFSLGGCCDAAAQLKRRGLRPFASPLDWIAIDCDVRAIRYLPTGIRTRFADFCLKENLRPHRQSESGHESGWSRYSYDDIHTGFMFIHHFDTPIEDDDAYNAVMRKFQRRFDRLYSAIDSADSAYFILETWFSYDPDLIDPLYAALVETWPNKKIALRVMQFSAPADAQQPERWGGGGLYRYRRRSNPYDFAETNWEWSFLDEYAPKQTPGRKPKGLARLGFKLCKCLRNALAKRGYDLDS